MENTLEVKVRLIRESARAPQRAHADDAAWDVFADSVEETPEFLRVKTGIAVQAPKGYSFLAFPRSSVSKTGWVLANSVGVIDNAYRGEIEYRFKKVSENAVPFQVGDRIGQLKLVKDYDLVMTVTDSLDETARGDGGFGSTGR
jgi:dUTP pyrophosphatase